ncbi:MAG: hypothetical protein ACKOTB_05120, partial [Planctomycetia bacterium]
MASIAGDAEVAVESQGRLAGSEMHLWLDVVAPAAGATGGTTAAATPGPDLSRVRPSRMLARGMVEVEAEPIAARTDRMEVWFKQGDPPPAAVASPGTPAAPPAAAVRPGALAAAQPGPARPGPAAPPGSAAPGGRGASPTAGRLIATAALVRGLVTVAGQKTELAEMSLEGQVHVVEEQRDPRPPAGQAAADAGLEIRGDQMQRTRPTRVDARAIVAGRPAQVRGRGLDLEGPLVDFDRGRNRLTVDGAGRLQVPLAAGAGGIGSFGFVGGPPVAPPTAPGGALAGQPGGLDVTWQGRMDFDGQTARFVDRVVTASGGTTMRAGSLDVVFDRPVEFAAARQPATRPDVARVACGGGVRIDGESQAEDGTRSSAEQLFVRDLVLDRGTGDVTGTGPGRLTSTRFGQPPAMAVPQAPGAPAPPAAPARADELTYLGV